MGGFMGWFLVLIFVLAVFNAEKLPALRQMLESKMKDSVEAAKEGAKMANEKLQQVKTEIDNKKNAGPAEVEPEENTPEEIAESLQFMGDYIKKEETAPAAPAMPAAQAPVEEAPQQPAVEQPAEDGPIDLEHRY